MTKIYIFIDKQLGTDVIGYAVAEDGTALTNHLSSNEHWFKHDMGLTSEWKHDIYRKHYPDGYELEYVAEPDKHAGLAEAYRLNQVLAAERGR